MATAAPWQHTLLVSWPWNQGSGPAATQFIILRRPFNGTYSQRATVSATVKSFLDTTVFRHGTYCYEIVAATSTQQSDPSSEGCATVK